MKARSIVLPGLALGFAALLIAPGSDSLASYTLFGSTLSTGQRDVRLYDNLNDAQSNNNNAPETEFPGYFGAELAIWKGITEWGSTTHGQGTGDPTQGVIGNGQANFDASWQGNALGVGGANDNIISGTTGCQSGVIAFAEGPYADGWRIRMCDDQWVFADGPGAISGGAFDIQGIIAHEYGHALGLGHSCNNAATMAPSGAPGQTSLRSLNFDDIAGIKAAYGAKASTKPVICQTSVSGTTMTITGDNFGATGNSVWFTNVNTTATGIDPRVIVSGLTSASGKVITLTIPASAGPGDVLVKIQGGTTGAFLSNAFPTDLVGTFSNSAVCPIVVDDISPDTVPALMPGTSQDVTITGSGFLNATDLYINTSTLIDPANWTIVNDTTITVDLPQFGFLATTNLLVASASDSDFGNITVEANTTPAMQLGTGDDFNVIHDGEDMRVVLAGTPGTLHKIYYSASALPSCHPKSKWAMGDQFSNFFYATEATIPAKGWTEFLAPVVFSGPDVDIYSQSIDITTAPAPMFGISNLQIFTLSE